MKISVFAFCLLCLTVNSALQSCPNSYFFDIQHCEKCQQNCICRAQNTCDSCIDGFTFYKNQCVQCPQASGIYGVCSGCCSRQTGTVLACTDCAVVPGKYSFLFSGRCILSDGCFEVDEHGFCSQCRNGYYQTNNLCYPCDSSCSTCTDSTNCLECNNGYYWKVNHGGLCTSCPSGCATCDDAGVCKSCLTSFYIYSDHCLQCPVNCLTCVDGSTCSSCSAGILVSNLCITCTDTTYGGSLGCLSCSENNNFIKCDQCDDMYFLDSSTGACRLCSSYITGAVRCRDQNTPTQCANDHDIVLQNRYYLIGISCLLNTKKCKKISNVQGNCATCYDGYIMLPTNQCQVCPFIGCKTLNSLVVANVCTCTQCDSGYYLAGASVVCTACTATNCALCPSNTCTQCKTGYYLTGATCTAAVVANCLTLASAATCQTCNSRYFKGSDNLCYSCQANCLSCTTRFTCLSCDTGFVLNNNVCVVKPNNCIEFTSNTLQCTLCGHGFYLFNGFCQQCTVQKGTLSQCQGLCPIDYYIKELLINKSMFGVTYIRLSIALLSIIAMALF